MILQRLITSDAMPEALYFRGDVSLEDNRLIVEPGGTAKFDTYFNLFSTIVWRQYTFVERLSVAIRVAGIGEAVLLGFAENPECASTICSVSFNSAEDEVVPVLQDATMDELPDHLYLKITADERSVQIWDTVYSGVTSVENEVYIACCFCTYRREKELLRNVSNLYDRIIDNPASPLCGRMEIYVADNGQTLNQAEELRRQYVHLFPNKNAGGTAGFTRCMIEAILKRREQSFTHVILMDDDAFIEPYVVERTERLLTCLRPEYRGHMIGGAMLYLEQPGVQMENGSYMNPKSGRFVIRGFGRELTRLSDVIKNEADEAANYNAWFYCVIPASFISADNLPLPMFIHIDDQEYGLRNRKNVIRMNGICIWHPDPWLRSRPYMEYYNARNVLITLSRSNPGISAFYICLKELYIVIRHILNFRYADAHYRIKGCADYYKGPKWFMSLDPEHLHREIMCLHPALSCTVTREQIEQYLVKPAKRIYFSKARKIINQLLPAFRTMRIYSEDMSAGCIDNFGVKQICIVDLHTGKGRAYVKDYRETGRTLREFLALSKTILTNHRRIHSDWLNALPELESLAFWSEYLSLRVD